MLMVLGKALTRMSKNLLFFFETDVYHFWFVGLEVVLNAPDGLVDFIGMEGKDEEK